MIERHSGKMQIVCACGFAQPGTYQADEFDVMVADAREQGFVIAKVGGEWTHTCDTSNRPAVRQRRLL